jgi:hypothetical protein
MAIAVTYLEEHEPKPRNSVSIFGGDGELLLRYSKVFLCDFDAEEILKPNPNPAQARISSLVWIFLFRAIRSWSAEWFGRAFRLVRPGARLLNVLKHRPPVS